MAGHLPDRLSPERDVRWLLRRPGPATIRCPFVAHLGRADQARPCPLLRPKRTVPVKRRKAGIDPSRTLASRRTCTYSITSLAPERKSAETLSPRAKLLRKQSQTNAGERRKGEPDGVSRTIRSIASLRTRHCGSHGGARVRPSPDSVHVVKVVLHMPEQRQIREKYWGVCWKWGFIPFPCRKSRRRT